MGHWAPGTKHYRLSDGSHVAITVDTEELTPLGEAYLAEVHAVAGVDLRMTKRIPRPTTVIACDDEGRAEHLTPLRTFPPGTTHEDAISQLEE